MISVSPFEAENSLNRDCTEVGYLRRRADHEAVAAILASDPRASDSHAVLAQLYGERSRALIEKLAAQTETPQPCH